MQARIAAACDQRRDADFIIMARTDAVAVEGLDRAIERAVAYVSVGADMIFAEAIGNIEDLRRFHERVNGPRVWRIGPNLEKPPIGISKIFEPLEPRWFSIR